MGLGGSGMQRGRLCCGPHPQPSLRDGKPARGAAWSHDCLRVLVRPALSWLCGETSLQDKWPLMNCP